MREINGLDLDQALSEVENAYVENGYAESGAAYNIRVKNAVNNQKTDLLVVSGNTLGQVLEGTKEDLGWKRGKISLFLNERTGKSTTDSSMPLREFQIGEEDVLSIEADYGVAAE